MEFTIDTIQKAYSSIQNQIIKTPIIRLAQLDAYLGCHVYIKAECMQKTGSFKFRGAMNMIMNLPKESLTNGIVTASSGNHGRACAYAGKMLSIPVTVVVPDTTPTLKIDNIRNLGAEIKLCPAVERFKVAEQICQEKKAIFIPPYNAYEIMAGQGTTGLEIMEQLPEVSTVIVPTSGGGLISGTATAIKAINHAVKVYGAEPAVLARYTASLKVGHPVEIPQEKTIADALVSNHPGDLCFPIVQKNIDLMGTAFDDSIKEAQKLLLTEGKIYAEISSCIGMAAVLEGNLPVQKDDNVCFLISGGNCSIEQLDILKELK